MAHIVLNLLYMEKNKMETIPKRFHTDGMVLHTGNNLKPIHSVEKKTPTEEGTKFLVESESVCVCVGFCVSVCTCVCLCV